jgi:hypothetical protein
MADDLMYRVRVASTGWTGGPGLNTFYYLQNLPADPDPSTAAAACVTRVHDLANGIKAIFPASWRGTISPEVDVINADNGDLTGSYVVTPPSVVSGTGTAGYGPQMAMICASLLTPDIVDSRRVRGRSFFGPSIVSDDPDGTPLTDVLAIVQAAMDLALGGGLDGPPMVVWSRRRGVSVRHPTGLGGSAHVVSAVTIKDQYAVLRSRRA